MSRDLARSGSKRGDSVVPDTPQAQGLLPVPGRSRDKPKSTAEAELSDGRGLCRSVACPAIWRAAAANEATRLYQTLRMRRFCCRSPADRGTSRAPTPSAESKAIAIAIAIATATALASLTATVQTPQNATWVQAERRRRRSEQPDEGGPSQEPTFGHLGLSSNSPKAKQKDLKAEPTSAPTG